MKARLPIQIALLLLLPFTIFIIVSLLFKDLYLAISASYLVLLLFFQYVALEELLLFRHLQELWRTQSETVMRFVFEPAEFQKPIVAAAPKVVLSDANLCNVAKLKYLLGETGSFIPGMRDEFRKLLFINIFLLIALMIITPPKSSATQQTGGNPQQASVQTVGGGGPGVNAPSSQVNAAPPASGAAEEFIRTQGRLMMSYFAVALQLVWLGRVLFHYRQKNADLYFQARATQGDINDTVQQGHAVNQT